MRKEGRRVAMRGSCESRGELFILLMPRRRRSRLSVFWRGWGKGCSLCTYVADGIEVDFY